jgi:hypothetical protein
MVNIVPDLHAEIQQIVNDPAFEEFLEAYWKRRCGHVVKMMDIRDDMRKLHDTVMSRPRDDPDRIFVADGGNIALQAAIDACNAYCKLVNETDDASKRDMTRWYIRTKLAESGMTDHDMWYLQ